MAIGRQWKVMFLVALLAAASNTHAKGDALAQARSLLDGGNSQGAYELLLPLQSARAGEVAYDYLLGLAALDAGQPGIASFALERVLVVDPDHAGAKVATARAYIAMRKLDQARELLTQVAQSKAPEATRSEAQRQLARLSWARNDIRGHLALTLGYDSNVTSATDERNQAIPAQGGTIRLLSIGEEDDVFSSLSGRILLRRPLGDDLHLLARGSAFQRLNNTEDDFDTGSLNAAIGLQYRNGDNIYSGEVEGDHYRFDYETLRNSLGVLGRWQHVVAPGVTAGVYLRYTNLDYSPAGQQLRDGDRVTLGATYVTSLDSERPASVYAGAYGGKESKDATGAAYLEHNFWGLRAGGNLELVPHLTAYASGSLEERDYDGADPSFLRKRDDSFIKLALGLDYRPWKKWHVIPEFRYIRNNSNIPVTDFDRYIYTVTLRRNFD